MDASGRSLGVPKHPVRLAQYRAALNQHILRKFLALVFVLDKAKATRLLPSDPILFNPVRGRVLGPGGAPGRCSTLCTTLWALRRSQFSQCKSSRNVLMAFGARCLKGEGDFIRHLSYLGIAVACDQKPLDEVRPPLPQPGRWALHADGVW